MSFSAVAAQHPTAISKRGASQLEKLLRTRSPYAAAATLGLFLHLWLAMPIYSWTDRLGAWVLLVVLLGTLRDFIRRRVKALPVFLLVATQLYIFYGIPQFSQDSQHLLDGVYRPTPRAFSMAVWLVVGGEILFLAGYSLTLRWLKGWNLFDRLLPTPRAEWRSAVLLYAFPSLAVYMLNILRPAYIPVVIRQVVLQFFNLWLALAFLLYLGYKRKDRKSLAVAWCIIGAMSFLGFVQGVMGNMTFPIVMGFVAAWLWGRAIKIRWLALILIAVIVVNPVKNRFRSLAWGDKDVSSIEKVSSRLNDWALAFSEVWSGASEDTAHQNVVETASRMSDLIPFSQAVDYVPSVVPYNYGKGMASAFFYWIPRIFWPSKKTNMELQANVYAIAFGYSTPEMTRHTSVGASVFTEGYWNFGVLGALLFPFAYGGLLGLLLGNNGGRGEASVLVAMTYLSSTMFLLGALTTALPGAVTFAVGVSVAVITIARLSDLMHPFARHHR